MALVHYEVRFHLVSNPEKTKVIRLLTGEDPVTVDEYLIREYGRGNVMLHYAEREKPQLTRTKTCGYCGCSREEVYVPVGSSGGLHPAVFDKSMWRLLE